MEQSICFDYMEFLKGQGHMKSVLVTGANGGMGAATVEALCKKGFRVFALDINAGEKSENIIPIQTDITSEESIRHAFDTVIGYTDNLYAIIHFAGIYMLDSLAEMSSTDFKRIFDVNLQGVFLVNKIFLKLLSEDSRILITTSELAVLDPLPFTGVYAVTKAALDKYAYSLRMELQLLKINVSVLRAGAVETGMIGASTDALERFCENTKLYSCNAKRFRKIVDSVEAKSISPKKVADKVVKIIESKHPSFAYSINRNALLLLMNVLPRGMQFWIIRKILK